MSGVYKCPYCGATSDGPLTGHNCHQRPDKVMQRQAERDKALARARGKIATDPRWRSK